MWKEAREAIKDSSMKSTIYIGCDSVRFKKAGVWYARYSTAVIVHKDSCKGARVFHNTKTLRDFSTWENLTPRLLEEVRFSIDTYEEIKDVLRGRHLEIHLDVNPDPKHKSYSVTAQALGWVRGMGLIGVTKPNACAASFAADAVANKKGWSQRVKPL